MPDLHAEPHQPLRVARPAGLLGGVGSQRLPQQGLLEDAGSLQQRAVAQEAALRRLQRPDADLLRLGVQ
eukprot:CAMPEP_0204549138 /NCGR_PEP_ID=MMETSP0661-20131031/24110_1 /ASSEMBLY_ACC=CAM_ASM_000606 /TAXON_ID=109239 /ORGANISM="Alexandrium margalefi, Strain AMGDE01CS-322" /LENGTH=68 /DNA_ID=CAMNT_0051556067 /DNA_START=1 /DNA_END=204 /DNA_ORIENTATION=+